MPARRIELKQGAWLDYESGWLPTPEADRMFAVLRDELPWGEQSIQVFGEAVLQPRLVTWGGALTYRYSGLFLEPRPLHPALEELMTRASDRCGVPFNHVVGNLYRNGHDRVAFHSDDEAELGRDPVIGSLSLGAERRFVAKPRRKPYRKRVTLEHGSLVIMGGTFQRRYRHAVPAQPGVEEPRINITFRRLLRPPDPRPWDDEALRAR